MAISQWDIVEAIRDHLRTQVDSGGDADLELIRYAELAADPRAIVGTLSGFPSLVVSPGDSTITQRYTGGLYAWDLNVTVTVVDSASSFDHTADFERIMGFEAPIRSTLDDVTLSITGIDRILWTGTDAVEPETDTEREVVYLMLGVRFVVHVNELC